MTKVTIIDYGVGNIASLKNAFAALAISADLSAETKDILRAERLILPGVGAFATAMSKLKNRRIDDLIKKKAQDGTPILGICLGMQLLFTASDEQGNRPGLNLIDGCVQHFGTGLKIPHMGWNRIEFARDASLFSDLNTSPYFYFVHSYYCLPTEGTDSIATCMYGFPFCAAINRDNIWGVQFHPEKSRKDGLQLLRNFVTKT